MKYIPNDEPCRTLAVPFISGRALAFKDFWRWETKLYFFPSFSANFPPFRRFRHFFRHYNLSAIQFFFRTLLRKMAEKSDTWTLCPHGFSWSWKILEFSCSANEKAGNSLRTNNSSAERKWKGAQWASFCRRK